MSTISEKLSTITGISNVYKINVSLGSVFYLSTIPTANMTFQLYNIPSITDASHTYVVSVIYKGTSSNYYCNLVNISKTTAGTGLNYIPKFTSTPNISTITNSQLIIQQIIFLYLSDSGFVISNISGYGS